MRISDWSSHVCSSDLDGEIAGSELPTTFEDLRVRMLIEGERLNIDGNWRAGEQGRGSLAGPLDWRNELDLDLAIQGKIGRASCRERGCRYVWIWVSAGPLTTYQHTKTKEEENI